MFKAQFNIQLLKGCDSFKFVETTANSFLNPSEGWDVEFDILSINNGTSSIVIDGLSFTDYLINESGKVTNLITVSGTVSNNGIHTITGLTANFTSNQTTITLATPPVTEGAGGVVVSGTVSGVKIGDVVSATLTVKNLTNGDEYPAVDIIPSSNDEASTIINSEDLDIDGGFPDGVYCFIYDITMDNGDEYEAVINKLWLCTSRCQLINMARDISQSHDCTCENKIVDQFNEASAILTAIEMGGLHANLSSVNNNIANLQLFLDNATCKGC